MEEKIPDFQKVVDGLSLNDINVFIARLQREAAMRIVKQLRDLPAEAQKVAWKELHNR